jgi:hypothetical protein
MRYGSYASQEHFSSRLYRPTVYDASEHRRTIAEAKNGLDILPGSRFSLFREESDRDKSHTGIRPSRMSHQVAFLLPSSTSGQYLSFEETAPLLGFNDLRFRSGSFRIYKLPKWRKRAPQMLNHTETYPHLKPLR